MQKWITMLLFLAFAGVSGIAQTSPCSNESVLARKAKWKDPANTAISNSGYAPQVMLPEFIKRINALHKLVLEAYPEGAGTEPWWSRFVWLNPPFGKNQPFSFSYKSGYPFYYCSQDFSGSPDEKDQVMKCYCAEYSTLLNIYANDLSNYLTRGSQGPSEINGRQVYSLAGRAGKWKGFDVFNLYGDSAYAERVVVISRKGMLPFHYMTRKEYLEYMIAEQKKMKEAMLNPENPDVPPILTPAQEEEKKKKDLAQIEKNIINPAWREKAKNEYLANYKTSTRLREDYFLNLTVTYDDEIKIYSDELKRSSDSLLNSPAVVGGAITDEDINRKDGSRFFSSEAKGGVTLVTENPDYFRKDLPRFIPQFFVLAWQWFGYDPQTNRKHLAAPEYFAKRIYADFPIEKLQAMIDK